MPENLTLNLSRRTPAPVDGEAVWPPREIAARLGGARAFGHVLRYRGVRVLVDDLDGLLSPRPLIAARAMARGRAWLEDDDGRIRPIQWRDLLAALAGGAHAAFAWRRIRRAVEHDLAALDAPTPAHAPGGEGVLVARPDIWFGLKAGGALAHTAGMLNAFAQEGLGVRLLTNERLGGLGEGVTQRIVARTQAQSRAERALLAYNRDLIAAADASPRPAFVYQRHGLYGYAGAMLARRFKAPFVLEHNGSEVWIGDHWGAPVPARDIAEAIERRMLAAADLITVVSKPLIEQVVALGASRDRVLLVPNAVDADIYRPDVDGAAVRARYGLGDAPVIGFIGTFGRWHGAPMLAAAFAAIAQAGDTRARLLMIGDGPERAETERIVAAAGLANRAVFTGLARQSEGPAYMAAADILVSPTLENPDGTPFFGSPTKLYEYMAMGRAIVASNLAQLGEVLAHERTALLTPPGDAGALAAALRRVIDDAPLRAALGAAARAEALAHHQWSHRARAVLAALQRV